MRFKSLLLAGVAAFLLPDILSAQMVPGTAPMVPAPVSSVPFGPANSVPYYATAGNRLTPIPTIPSSVFITTSGGVPGWNATLSGIGNIVVTTTSAPSNGCAFFTSGDLGSSGATCGTGTVSPGTTNDVAIYTGSTTIGPLSTAANSVLWDNASGVPSMSTSPTIGVSVTTPQIYGGSLPSNQLRLTATSSGSPSNDKIFLNAGGLIKETIDDGGVFIAQGVPGSSATAQLEIGPVTTSAGSSPLKFVSGTLMTAPEMGAIEYVDPALYFTNSSGIRHQFMIGSPSGNTNVFATANGSVTNGNCLQGDANGNITSIASPCGTGSGTISPGATNDALVYTGTNTIGPVTTSPLGVYNTDASGVPTITDSPTIGTLITVPNVIGGTAPSSNLTIMSTSSGSPSGDFIDFEVGGSSALTINGSGQALFNFMVQLPSEAFVGSSSGAVTIQPDTNAGTYTMTLPTTPGSAGQVLTSAGGGATAMTWTTIGSGTVNPGLINQLSWYNATGSAVSGLATASNGTLVTSAGGVPSISSTLPNAVQNNITRLGGVIAGTIDNVVIGNNTPAAAVFTNVNAFQGAVFTNGLGGSPTQAAAIQIGENTGAQFITLNFPGALSSSYNWNFPTTAGTAGQVLTSAGGGNTSMTWTSVGSVSSSTLDAIAYYPANGSNVSGIPTANNAVLATNSSGTPSVTASPTIGTSITTPTVYGGSSANSALMLMGTSSGAPSGDTVKLLAGTGIVRETVTDSGVCIGPGGCGSPTAGLQLVAGTATAGTSPLKFVSGTLMTTPETGAIEYNAPDLYLTNNAVRRNVMVGSAASIAAATITTTPANFAQFNVVSGETYIVDIVLEFTSVANTPIIGFNGTSTMDANILSISQLGNGLVTTNAISQLAANSASTVTCIGNSMLIRISGIMTATSTGTFSISIASNTGTISLLNGSYYKYNQM